MALEKIGQYLRDLMVYRSININIDILKFESAIKRMFKDWEIQVQNKLTRHYTTKSLVEKALNKKEIEAIARIKLGSHPKRLATISQAAAQKGLEHSYTDINAVLSWDINMSPLADFYVSHYKTFTDKISQNLQDRIKSEIALGVRDGTPYPELRKKISKIFSKPIPVHVAEKLNRKGEVIRRAYDYNMDNKRWTDMVARTETQRALNNGRVYGYQQSNTAKTLRWVANPGACPDCSFRSGEIYKVEEAQDLIPLHPECLISGKVYVYTSKGWKAIKDIKVHDYVLTHKGRFKKVTNIIRTSKQTPEVVEIKFKRKKLVITDNHPVLVNGKWILAKEIKKGDVVKLLAGECKRCKKLIPFYNKYCSYSCNSKDITKRQWANPEHHKNISRKASNQLKREYRLGIRNGKKITEEAHKKTRQMAKEGKHPFQREDVRRKSQILAHTPVIRKRSSERMKKYNPSYIPEVRKRMTESYRKFMKLHPEKHPNVIMAKKGFISGIEKKIKGVLDELKIGYTQQHSIKRYYVDFAIPDLKIAIEADGMYWHKNKERDAKRQKDIEQLGWFFLRYNDNQINNNLGGIKNEIQNVIYNHLGNYKFIDVKISSIKKWKIEKPRMLYNLTVEEDESYVAKGFVVHNCRCTWIVEEYKTFEEAEKGIKAQPDKFADPEKIYSDPNGVHIMDFFKGTLDEKDFKLIETALQKGITTKALKSLKKLKTTKVSGADYVKKYPEMLKGTSSQRNKFMKGLEPLPMEHVKPIYSIDIVDSIPGYVAGFHSKGYITMSKIAHAKDIAHEIGHNVYRRISAEFKSEFIKYAMPYHTHIGKASLKTVSSYAKKNLNEHFCENYMFYYHNPEVLKKVEPTAFKIFNTYLKEYE